MFKRWTIVVGLLVFFFLLACGKEITDKKSDPQFMVQTTVPKNYQLDDNAYPTEKCVPFQLRAVDAKNQKNFSLPSPRKVQLKLSDPLPTDMNAAVYSDSKCRKQSEIATLPKADGKPSLVTVYLRSEKEGKVSFRMSFGGRSWSAARFGRLTFKKSP